MGERLLVGAVLDGVLGPKFEEPLYFNLRIATPADIAAHLLTTETGPEPWRDGDERCHCTHCDACGRLYRTADIRQHREACPVVTVAHALRDLQAEVPRVG